MALAKIKKGDIVRVITGKDKGLEGKVLSVHPKTNRIVVENIHKIIKHVKQNGAEGAGGRVEAIAPIHISNVMLVVDGKATRVGIRKDENGERVRYAKATGKTIS